MSQRRFSLLCLLIFPVVLFCINLLYPGVPGDQQNGLQMIALIIGIPIIFLNAWEWQQPETLDNLLRANFLTAAFPGPIKANSIGRLILFGAGGLIFFSVGLAVFGEVRQALGMIPTGTPAAVLDVGAIQTAAVRTALADNGQSSALVDVTPQASAEGNVTVTKEPDSSSTPVFRPEATATGESSSGLTLIQTPEPEGLVSTPTPEVTLAISPEASSSPTAAVTGPIVLSGTGNSIVDFQKWAGPALVVATYSGEGTFEIARFSSSAAQNEILVNTSGDYTGTLPFDFLANESTSQLIITATGTWKLQIIALGQARVATIPATIQGNGDSVFVLAGAVPNQLTYDALQADGDFVIRGFRSGGWDVLVDETAPFNGSLQVASDITVLAVTALGAWSITLTGQ